MNTELIARLEAADVGSRELDALIWLRLNRPEHSGDVKALEMRVWYDGRGHMILETDAGEELADNLGIGPCTTSLDAALALALRVLPGCPWELYPAFKGRGYMRYGCNVGDGETAYASTPALALCIAILRALDNSDDTA